jgi:hypothetical protein
VFLRGLEGPIIVMMADLCEHLGVEFISAKCTTKSDRRGYASKWTCFFGEFPLMARQALYSVLWQAR